MSKECKKQPAFLLFPPITFSLPQNFLDLLIICSFLCFVCLFFFALSVFFLWFLETVFHAAQTDLQLSEADLELLLLRPLHPKRWD